MSTIALTIYFLVWPLIVLGVMSVVGFSFFKEWRESHNAGEDII